MDIDNVLIGISILLPALLLLTCSVRFFANQMNFTLQLMTFVALICAIIGSSYYIFGKEVSLYLVSGLAIGIGVALKPLFVKVMNGMIFDATRIYHAQEIKILDIQGKIIRVGLLHTWIQDNNGNKYMIGNSMFEDHPVEIIKQDTSSLEASGEALKFL